MMHEMIQKNMEYNHAMKLIRELRIKEPDVEFRFMIMPSFNSFGVARMPGSVSEEKAQ